tara:strand:+ start:128 stop:418 length:291 start_codon:yes stop_codon:yes gene_type:complete
MKYYTSDKDGNLIEVDELPILPEPTKEQIDALPWGSFRDERNRLLAETDWWAVGDRTMTQEQKDYRKALRDLPETTDPKFDEDWNLTNITWPTKPE